ncbi:MAG: Hsp20/alpha crystallin family protein [Blastocatellia bacterium]
MAKAREATQQPDEKSAGLARRETPGMAHWSASPFSLMSRFADEMERVFEDFGFGPGRLMSRGWGEFGRGGWSPQIEAFEQGGQFIVRADLPGLNKDDVKIDVTDNALTIQGERKQQREENREGFYRSERSYGSFYRSIPLPEGTDAEKAKATFRDGVLEITMPAPQREEQRRRIEITS